MSGTRQCGWCLNPYEHQPPPPAEIEAFRHALLVCDPAWEPSVCEDCFAMVMETASPAGSLERSPNFLLRVA